MAEEYIKRSELIKKVEQEAEAMSEPYKSTFAAMVDWQSAKVVPVNDVVPVRRGKWECDSDGIPKCSCCEKTALQRILLRFQKPEYVSHFVLSNFCPNCGADMRMDGE